MSIRDRVAIEDALKRIEALEAKVKQLEKPKKAVKQEIKTNG